MARKYYSLLQKENGLWNVQFGDYNREIVEQELDDMSYTEDIKKKDLKIVGHKDNETQTSVVNRINKKEVIK